MLDLNDSLNLYQIEFMFSVLSNCSSKSCCHFAQGGCGGSLSICFQVETFRLGLVTLVVGALSGDNEEVFKSLC